MGTFSFVITGAERDDIRPDSGNSDWEVVVDKNMARSVKQQVLNAQFGDGYEQRAKDGLNTKREQYTVGFVRRPAEEVNEIAAYLDYKTSESFDLTITNLGGDEVIKVVCDDYKLTYLYENFHSLTAKFRRVYEP